MDLDCDRIGIHFFDCHDGEIAKLPFFWEVLERTIGELGEAVLVAHGESIV